MLKSNADYSVYQGWEVTGWPLVTLRRSQRQMRAGRILGLFQERA